MVGPFDFTTNHECGVLVDGYEQASRRSSSPGTTPTTRTCSRATGLTKAMDLLKWELLGRRARRSVLPVIFELAEKLEPEHGITIRQMRQAQPEGRGRGASWRSTTPPGRTTGASSRCSDNEFEHYAKELKPILDENWAMVAEKDGETVGAALTLPDYNQVLAAARTGGCCRFGWLKALRERRKIDPCGSFALGVKPEYQHTGRRRRPLRASTTTMAEKTPQTGGEMGWILEIQQRHEPGDGGDGREDRQALPASTRRPLAARSAVDSRPPMA